MTNSTSTGCGEALRNENEDEHEHEHENDPDSELRTPIVLVLVLDPVLPDRLTPPLLLIRPAGPSLPPTELHHVFLIGNGCSPGEIRMSGQAPMGQDVLAGARLSAIVAASDDAICTVSPEGTITGWNRGAEQLYGYSAAEIVGQSLSRLVPPDRELRRQLEEQVLQSQKMEAVGRLVRELLDGG